MFMFVANSPKYRNGGCVFVASLVGSISLVQNILHYSFVLGFDCGELCLYCSSTDYLYGLFTCIYEVGSCERYVNKSFGQFDNSYLVHTGR